MNRRTTAVLAVAGLLASPMAYAQGASGASSQGQGTTSGPAAGSNVEPSTVTHNKSKSSQDQTKGSSEAVGSPGTPAKSGSEGGPPPK